MTLAEAPVIADNRNAAERATTQTTLYDLIATMSDAAPDAEELINATVIDLLRSRRIHFLSSPSHVNAIVAAAEAA